MKPKPFFKPGFILPILIGVFSLTLVAWGFRKADSPQKTDSTSYLDTIPKNKTKDGREKKIRDLDDVINELNEIELKVEMEKVHKEFNEAMKKFDSEKMKLEIERAMKEVDFQKIQKDIQESMAKINWEKINKEFESVQKIDMSKMEEDMKKLEKEMKELGPKLEKEMAEIKKMDWGKIEADFKKIELEMKELGPKLEKEMQGVKEEMERAKRDMQEFKGFVDGLEKDGLINKKEDYTIEHRNGELTINGKRQSAELYSKYKGFLEKHKSFKIEKSEDDFNIDID